MKNKEEICAKLKQLEERKKLFDETYSELKMYVPESPNQFENCGYKQVVGQIALLNWVIASNDKGKLKAQTEQLDIPKHSFKFDYRFGYLSKEKYRHFPIIYLAYGTNGFSLCILGATITVKLW